MGGRWVAARGHDALDDRALAAAVVGQSRDALDKIYRRHGAAVWSVAKVVCNGARLAEDVCAAVFTELWSHPERFDPDRGTLRAWLIAEVHARAVTAVRSTRSARVTTTAPTDLLSHTARRAIDRLETLERDSILLAYVGGHTCRETARLLGIPEDKVKSSMRRGLLNLRQTLQAEGVST